MAMCPETGQLQLLALSEDTSHCSSLYRLGTLHIGSDQGDEQRQRARMIRACSAVVAK
jgi:hypothetical protein